MKVLFFAAHPDDLDVFCQGTIWGLLARGHEIFQIYATKGEIGTPFADFRGERLGRIREREAREAARVFGIDQQNVIFLGFHDGSVKEKYTLDSINIFKHWIEMINPRVIFAPEADEASSYYRHPDHQHVGKMVREVCQLLSWKQPLLFYHSMKSNFYVRVKRKKTKDTREVHLSQWYLIPFDFARKIPVPIFRLSQNLVDGIYAIYAFRKGFKWVEPYRKIDF
ncbi:MAG: PIG-L deacetylase family protein [Candidatus Helarchaeota archaeon]